MGQGGRNELSESGRWTWDGCRWSKDRVGRNGLPGLGQRYRTGQHVEPESGLSTGGHGTNQKSGWQVGLSRSSGNRAISVFNGQTVTTETNTLSLHGPIINFHLLTQAVLTIVNFVRPARSDANLTAGPVCLHLPA